MVHRVHQQVPQASVEAIRYDLGQSNSPSFAQLSFVFFFVSLLEITKDIQKTIANLNERVAAAARAAASQSSSTATLSRAISNSTSSAGHRQTYERLKEELIEKNRQLFLQKNAL